jgi:hypothetical protein
MSSSGRYDVGFMEFYNYSYLFMSTTQLQFQFCFSLRPMLLSPSLAFVPPHAVPKVNTDQFIAVWRRFGISISNAHARAFFDKYGKDTRGLMPVMVRRDTGAQAGNGMGRLGQGPYGTSLSSSVRHQPLTEPEVMGSPWDSGALPAAVRCHAALLPRCVVEHTLPYTLAPRTSRTRW